MRANIRCFPSVLFIFLSLGSAGAGEQATAHLIAQVWHKESIEAGDPVYYTLGEPQEIRVSLSLSPVPEILSVKKRVETGELTAFLTFYRVNSSRNGTYVSTQTRLVHRTKGLIAECSRYDSPRSTDIGVGSCSGAIAGKQFGVSLLRAGNQ